MVNVPASSAVDYGFEIRSGQTKDYTIGICCFSAKHITLRKNSKDAWLGISIICPCGPTCLSADCSISELVLWKSNKACWSSTKRTSSSSHWKLACSHNDIGENVELTLNNKHSLILQCCIQLIVRSDQSFLLFSL